MKKIKVVAIVVAILAVGIAGLYLYDSFFKRPPPIIPPTTEHSSILIDLSRPDEGMISLSYSESETSGDDFMLVAGAVKDAVEILDWYYIPHVDPATVRPLRQASMVTVSFAFFAKDKYEFVWPESTFTSTWAPMWQVADLSLVLPEGYEIVSIKVQNVTNEPARDIENNRWKITTRTIEGEEFQMEVIYRKSI